MTVDQSGTTSPFARYVFCLLASLVPAAPAGPYKSATASGAFIRSESVSVFGLWMGVGVGTLIAAPLFWLLMKLGSPTWTPSVIRVAVVALVSAFCLGLLGQVAAATAWLNEYVAGAIWLAAMLTVGSVPFTKGRNG